MIISYRAKYFIHRDFKFQENFVSKIKKNKTKKVTHNVCSTIMCDDEFISLAHKRIFFQGKWGAIIVSITVNLYIVHVC